MRVKKRAVAKLAACIVAIGLLVGGGAIGWLTADKRYYESINKYSMLDPSVSEPNVRQDIINFDPLRQNLKTYLAGVGLDHSLYFEYLSNGANIRDGADTVSIAASLMKTPVVMDLYKLSEQGKLNLDNKVAVTPQDISTDQDFGNPTKLQIGNQISLRDAARITLQDSDNTTVSLIKNRILPQLSDSSDSIQSLDISYSLTGATPGNEQVEISALSYSSVLKCLYFACFDTPQDSSQILNYMTGSVDTSRLVAGVGSGITVAHKIGSSDTSQSDCGIVYYPGKPYLVCLMFLNLNPGNVNTVDPYFQHVSQMIYNYVSTSGSSN